MKPFMDLQDQQDLATRLCKEDPQVRILTEQLLRAQHRDL